MKMLKIQWKSSEDKQPAEIRAKVFKRAAGWNLSVAPSPWAPMLRYQWKSLSHADLQKSEKPRKSARYDESPQRPISQPGTEQRFYKGSRLNLNRRAKAISTNIPNSINIYRNEKLWKSIKCAEIYENLENTMKVFRKQEASLESDRAFHYGSKSELIVRRNQAPKHWKSLRNHENQRKPSSRNSTS